MSGPHLIGPPPVSTPANLKRSRGSSRDLPDDLLKEASIRLGIMSVLFAVIWVVASVAGNLAERAIKPDSQGWLQFDIGDGIAVASVVVSLALFVYIRKGDKDPRFVLDLGLWYMVFTALSLGLLFHIGGVPIGGPLMHLVMSEDARVSQPSLDQPDVGGKRKNSSQD